jgi:hypothetical protein
MLLNEGRRLSKGKEHADAADVGLLRDRPLRLTRPRLSLPVSSLEGPGLCLPAQLLNGTPGDG